MASAVTFNDGRPAETVLQRVPLAAPTSNPCPSVPASTTRPSATIAVGLTTTPVLVASVEETFPSAPRRRTPAPYVPTSHSLPTAANPVIQLCFSPDVAVVRFLRLSPPAAR